MGDAKCKQAAGARSKISRKAREQLIFLGPEFFVPLCHDWYAEKKNWTEVRIVESSTD